MRTFAHQWTLHGVYATGRAQRYYVSPSQINMGDRPKRMSCLLQRFVEEFCQLCEKKIEKVERKRKTDRDLYIVEVVEVDTTRKQLKLISWDSVTNTMSGVITIIKEITFPSFAWKKCFSPRKVRWRIEATFTGNCIFAWFLNIFSIMCARADSLVSSSAFEMV